MPGRVVTPSDAATPPGETRALPVLRWLIAGAAGMTALLCLLPATGHDQMWLLYAARQMLHGETLYGSFLMESNPPLILWILTVPAWLGDHLGLPSSFFLKAITLALGVASAWASLWLLRSSDPVSVKRRAWLCFSFLVLLGAATARDFAQRDHLLALLCLPYILSIAARAEGTRIPMRWAILLGAATGLGIALKPHHALLFLAMEAYLALRARSLRTLLRPEPWIVVLCGLLYVVSVRIAAPSYLREMVPLLRDCYWAFGSRSIPQLVFDAIELHLLAIITFAVWFRRRRASSPFVTVLLLAGIAATLSYYAQATGWYYQQLPAITFFGLALALLLPPMPSLPRWSVAAAASLTVLALALTTHFMGYPFTAARALPIDEPSPAFFTSLPRSTPVLTLTTDLDTTIPPVWRWHLTWAGSMPHLWMLPAILRAESPAPGERIPARLTPARIAQLDALQHTLIAEDIEHWHPQLILIERCYDPSIHCQVLTDRHDNLLAWFERDAAFRTAFARYAPVDTQGRPDARFDAYRRVQSKQ